MFTHLTVVMVPQVQIHVKAYYAVHVIFSPSCCRSITPGESCLKKPSLRDTPQRTLLEPISEHPPVWGFSTVFQGIDRAIRVPPRKKKALQVFTAEGI